MRDRLTTPSTTLLLFAVAISLPGCDEDPPTWAPSGTHYSQCLSQPQPARQSIDLLFVVDDSTAMAGFEQELQAQMPAMVERLQNMSGDLPDLHLGVVTSVLGTAPHTVDGCPAAGHAGQMRTGSGAGPVGATYLKDVRPSGCVQTRDATGFCPSHTCEEANCGHELDTWLVIDDNTGCPRCRNYNGRLSDAFADTANVGVMDCPYSQPMEAMKLALQNDVNPGFVRDEAFLGIIFVTAQDDCSARGPQLFDGADGSLGPLTSFRCFEQGVTCDVNGRNPGARQNCVPREDAESLLHPLSGYVTTLQELKAPQLLMVAGVVGPFELEDVITVELDPQGNARLAPSCTLDATQIGTPAVRLHSFLAAFNEEEDLSQWAQTSICAPDYTAALSGSGSGHNNLPPPNCFELPLRGCTDPGAAMGDPRDAQACNDACQPNCTVTDIQRRGLPEETAVALPHCLEVCVDGPCPGNTDATQAYADGQPPERDYRLPVPACWYVSAERCSDTGEVIVARQADPPRRSFVDICCELAPDVETDCHDGLDEDGDCLVDLDDPDCAGQ